MKYILAYWIWGHSLTARNALSFVIPLHLQNPNGRQGLLKWTTGSLKVSTSLSLDDLNNFC